MIALQVLETCPLVPVDAFVHLAGLSSQSSAYQQLARLRHAGLAEVRRVDPGYLVGDRRLGCWTITDKGRRALAAGLGRNPLGQGAGKSREEPGARGLHSLSRVADNELPLLIASYRLLASLMLELAARGQAVEIQTSEWPWVREACSPADGNVVRVRMPAGATLKLCETGIDPDPAAEDLVSIVLVPDLGTAPVVRYREMLRRLVALRERDMLSDGSADAELELVIATPDLDGTKTRSGAWQQQLDSVVRRHGAAAVQVRVLTWDRVADVLKRKPRPDLVADERPHSGPSGRGTPRIVGWPAPARSHEQLLHLIARHPCLTVGQLALLLGTAVDRIRRLERELVEDGLLRRIGFEELPLGATSFRYQDFASLGLVEITSKGRRQAAGWLGLTPPFASRYHGLSGNASREAGRRWRSLRTLAHTVGTNAVFVAFAVAGDAVTQAGGAERLTEWRSAAACERHYCKPDGYGCYVRDGVAHGFFVEYDRGTEADRKYAAKFRAYYRYRDGGHAAHDYDGFPTLLFITTEAAAEHRILERARREWFVRGTEPLPVLVTSVDQIRQQQHGILGRIWRTPVPEAGRPARRHWPANGPARSLSALQNTLALTTERIGLTVGKPGPTVPGSTGARRTSAWRQGVTSSDS